MISLSSDIYVNLLEFAPHVLTDLTSLLCVTQNHLSQVDTEKPGVADYYCLPASIPSPHGRIILC